MPTIVTEAKHLYPWLENHGCGDQIGRRTGTFFKKIKAHNERSSRVKPQDLIGSMTSLNKQYVKRQAASDRTEVATYVCGSTGANYNTYRRSVYIYTLFTEPPEPNWALDLREKIAQLKLDLSGTVAEFDETVYSTVRAAKGLYNAYKRSKRGWKRRRLTHCSVGSANLALSFGIMPLLNDSFETYMNLKEILQNDLIVRVQSFSVKRGDQKISSSQYQGLSHWESSARAVAYVLLKHNRLTTVGDPARWAWERIPFSFAVDYVWDIGGYLQAVSALQGIDLKSCCVTFKKRYNGSLSRTTLGLGDSFSEHNNVPQYEDFKSHERKRYYAIPIPRPPAVSPSLSIRRLANSLSVIQGLTTNNCRPKR